MSRDLHDRRPDPARPLRPGRAGPLRPLPRSVGLEIRKSLSTRSGMALVAVGGALVRAGPPCWPRLQRRRTLGAVAGPIGVMGAADRARAHRAGCALDGGGVDATGRCRRRSCWCRDRGRVLAAKAAAVALMGAAVAAVSAAASLGVMPGRPDDVAWDGVAAGDGGHGGRRGGVRGDRCRRRSGDGQHPGGADRLYLLCRACSRCCGSASRRWATTSTRPTRSCCWRRAGGARRIVILAGWVVVSSIAGGADPPPPGPVS